jgi:glycosyltransferase involved in cell wall biosynthesis
MSEPVSSKSMKRGERMNRWLKPVLRRWFKGKQARDKEILNAVEVIRNSGLFDEAYYRASYGGPPSKLEDPIYHYCAEGWQQGANPSSDFDTQFYLETNPDIRDAGSNPFVHYILAGVEEQREPNPRARQERIHAKILSEVEIIRASGLFDEGFYRTMYPESAAIYSDPIYHYCALGWREDKDPSDEFDSDFYRQTQPDIEEYDLNPFLHYVQAGIGELRQPTPDFYLAAQKDVWFGRVNTEIKLLAFYVTPDWSGLRDARSGSLSGTDAPLPEEELGFYDAADPDVLRLQATLAARHGLNGFCFEVSPGDLQPQRQTPVRTFRRTTDINFHFCIQLDCEQIWPDHEQIAILADVMRDSRYVCVDGRPVLVLSLAAHGLEMSSTHPVNALIERLQALGVPRPYSMVRAADDQAFKLEAPFFLDARLDLPGQPLPAETGAYLPVLKDGVNFVPYQVVVAQGIQRAQQGESATGSLPSFHAITLRRHGMHPKLEQPLVYSRLQLPDYRKWLQTAMDVVRHRHPSDRRLIFINSWNNWNQGQVLEPDRQYGFACLNETTKTLLDIETVQFLPKVTVIVPNYNHAGYLKQRLDSIYQQTYKNIEVLLLDDCSSDSSREILDAYAEANSEITRTIYNEHNSGGVFQQWARGILAASGELIWIAESDDYCDLDFLETLTLCFQDEAVLLAYAKSVFIGEDGTPLPNGFRYHLIDIPDSNRWLASYVETAHKEVSFGLGIKNTIPNASSVLFRRPPEMPLLNDPAWLQLRVVGDWIFYLHLIRGGKVAFSVDTHNYFRRYSHSTANVSFSHEYFYREVGFANETVARLFNVSEEVHHLSRQSFLKIYRHHFSQNDDDFGEWFGYQRVLAAKQARLPNVMVATMGFYPGGAEILPIRLANEFRRTGLAVTLLSVGLHSRERGVRELLRNDVALVETSQLELTEALIKSFGIEVLNSHQWFVQRYPFDRPSVFQDLKAHVASLHGMIEYGNDLEVTRDELLAADQNVTTWIYTADKNLGPFINHHILESSQARFIKLPNGIQPPEIKPIRRADLGIPQEAFVLCCVSRAIPEKGWPEAIEVVSRARERSGRDIRLIFVGNGEVYENLSRLGTPFFVHLVGFSGNSVGHYAAADLGIMLTRFPSESFPLTIVDALFAGRPYLATDVGEIRNMLSLDEKTAGDVIALDDWQVPIDLVVDSLLKFVLDQDYYAESCRLARALANRYRIDVVAAEYVEIFKQDSGSLPVSERRQ